MAKKNALTKKNATNENWRQLGLAVIASAQEALGGARSRFQDRHAKACGFENGEQDALCFFASDWAEDLIDMVFGHEDPDILIVRILEDTYGPIVVQPSEMIGRVCGPHIRRRTGKELRIRGGMDGLAIKLISN
jgi:hypothetical protein